MILGGLASQALSVASSLIGPSGAARTNNTTGLSQARQGLFARIDTNGDGSISQGELTSFLNQLAAARGSSAPSAATVSSLFSALDTNHNGSISQQEFQGGGASLFDQLRGQIVSNAATMASVTASAASNATSVLGTHAGAGAAHGHHHGGHGGTSGQQSVAAQMLQQYQGNGTTPSTTGIGRALNVSV